MHSYGDNPFNAGFGVRPPVLAGREELLQQILAGLNRGPGRAEFHTLLLGARGTGKTVLLRAVEEHLAADKRWLFLHWAGTQSLEQSVREQNSALEAAMRNMVRRGLRRIDPEVTFKAAPGGVGADIRVGAKSAAADPASTHLLLERLAEAAALRHRTIVVLVDELHAASITDLQTIGVAIQRLANVRELPIALIAAGVPQTVEAFQRANVTFMERLQPSVVDNLDASATRDALEIPFLDAGRRFHAPALDYLAVATGGYPFAVQLAGSHCWNAAGDSDEIALKHAKEASKQTSIDLTRTVFVSTWQRIRPAEQLYLYAAAKVRNRDDAADSADIARFLGRTTPSIARSRDRLINSHSILRASQWGTVQFTLPGFAAWVQKSGDRLRAEQNTAHLRRSEQDRSLEP